MQLDALDAGLGALNNGKVSEDEALERLARSPHGVWDAMDPERKLLLASDVGTRTRAMAQGVVQQVMQVLAPNCVPVFLTDGLKASMTALLTPVGSWVPLPRRQAPGPALTPRWMPRPDRRYAQVVKQSRRRRLVGVRHRVMFGSRARVKQGLAATGWQLNPAVIERVNLAIRQHVAAVGRRVTTLCKHEDGLRQQWALCQTDHNFCLPHAR